MNKISKSLVVGALSACVLSAVLLVGCASESSDTSSTASENEAASTSVEETTADNAATEESGSQDAKLQAVEQAEADGRIVVTGTLRIYSGAELAKIQNFNLQEKMGNSGDNFQYAVVQFAEPTSLTIAASGDMGALTEGEATMVCLAVSEPDWDNYEGDLSFWEQYKDEIVMVSLDPEDTWWPSDVRLPIGEPHTSTAEFLFAE